MDTIGKRVRDARIEKGLTQLQLAKAAGVSKQAISKIESDKTRTSAASTLEPIARKLGINLRTLMDGKASREPQAATGSASTPDAAYLANVVLELSAAITETIPALGNAWRARLADMKLPAGFHEEIHEALLIALESGRGKGTPHTEARSSARPLRKKA